MLVVETSHGPGVVGFTGGEIARYHAFTLAWSAINVPQHSRGYGGLGYDTACNSNAIIDYAVKQPDMQWVWIMDDDHTFSPDTLIRLLDKEVDIVVPLYAQRQAPFRPCAYKAENEDGSYTIHNWVDFEGKDGLLPVVSAGKGGVLLRRRVIEALKAPWFEWNGVVGEDHYFFKKCRNAGFQPYVALDVPIDHLTTMPVSPLQRNGLWCPVVNLGGNPPAKLEYWDRTYQGRV